MAVSSAIDREPGNAVMTEPRASVEIEAFEAFFAEAPCGCVLLDPIEDGAGGLVDCAIKLSNRLFRQLGLIPAERDGEPTLLKALGERPRWFEILAATAADGTPRRSTERNERQGRTYLIQVFRPKPGMLAASFEDVSERVGYEEMLRRDAAKYRSIFENIQDVYFETDLNGLLLEISPSVEEMLRYRREAIIGTPVDSLFRRPAEAQRIRESLLSSNPAADFEIEALDGDGKLVVCALSATLRKEAATGRDRICGTLHNVTDRQRHEMAVKANEKRLREIIDLVPYPIFARDGEGRYLLGNRALAEFYGLPLASIIGRTIREVEGPESNWEIMEESDRRVLETQETVCVPDATLTDGSGRVRNFQTYKMPCDLTGEGARHVMGIAIDVTEQREAEQDRLRLAMAAEQAAEAIVITDAAGTIQYVNPAFERISGYPREEAIGRTPRLLKSGKHPDAFYREMWDALQGGEPWRGNMINKRKDGSFYEEFTTITPVRDSTGRIANYIAVKRDVSQELRVQERLQQAMKLEAIGTLAGGIAHDFNNILTAIIGYTELVMNQLPREGRAWANLEQVLTAGKRAQELVRQIRMFSRQSESEKAPIQIHLIVKEALKLLRASLPTTIEIRERIGGDCGEVIADSTQIHQLVMNLCTNAYQAMPNGGLLEVSLRRIDVGPEQAQAREDLHEGQYALLSITDTGKGMAADLLERIFDPYFTTREKGGGTGLGLSTVHGIVAGMDGTISVYSEVGKGTRFDVYLPASRPEARLRSIDEPPTPRGRGERILWVDDEAAILQFGQEMLRRIGYQVETANGSLQALALFRADPGRFDAVITDQTMPKMTGAQLIEAMRELRSDLPYILSTGFSESLTEDDIARLGIMGFVEKPFTLNDLANILRNALGEK
jgi:PAS domain S-box-containing protein